MRWPAMRVVVQSCIPSGVTCSGDWRDIAVAGHAILRTSM
ncbi:MAG: hypothetical protein RL541_885, partial [Pseudomonadota bacterium]